MLALVSFALGVAAQSAVPSTAICPPVVRVLLAWSWMVADASSEHRMSVERRWYNSPRTARERIADANERLVHWRS